jgi:hypothetical protein
MEETEQKNQLSIAFMQMLAANAGFEILKSTSDYNGVDLSMRSDAQYPSRWGAEIDFQLKCTSHAGHQHPKFISYPLERKVYEKLSRPDRFQLGALAVLVVPSDSADWLHQDEERLFAKGCMYFSPATEWEPMAEGADTRSVRCYRSNILTVDALAELLQTSASMWMLA